jgi:sn-glycerol 3-phosphate transport system permease protein
MLKRAHFRHPWLPFALVAPQIAITLVFFIWPALQALRQSLYLQDAFGLSKQFVWLENFTQLFGDPSYWNSFHVTIVFSVLSCTIGIVVALLFAVMADHVIRGAGVYKTFLIWPYAVAPAVAGVLWTFLFNPTVGILPYYLDFLGYEWNHYSSGNQALGLVVIASVWNRISYNFLFFLAGLQAIPKSVIEAAAIDGAGPVRRLWSIVLPLLSPTTFFLIVVNVVYTFFETFGIVHAVTEGGPAQATEILVYKVFRDGFVANDYGASAAQSVILMLIVTALTVVQFRYIERRVQY